MPLRRRKPRIPAVGARSGRPRRQRPMPYGMARPAMPGLGRQGLGARARQGKAGIMKPAWSRSGLSRIWLIGPLLEMIRNFVFRWEAHRQYKRAPMASGLGNLVQVKMELARRSQRPRYIKAGERAPHVTAAKGHQLARRGRVAGVYKHPVLERRELRKAA